MRLTRSGPAIALATMLWVGACASDAAPGSGVPPAVDAAPAAPAPAATSPDAAPTPPAGCATPTGPGTEHATSITADETWTAAASPHVIVYDLDVKGATLTIEPCAM